MKIFNLILLHEPKIEAFDMNEFNVFDVKRFALHDGPGIRTTVFLKGCSLKCAWCHNPESISTEQQLMYTSSRCIHDYACVLTCEQQAISFTESSIEIDSSCALCLSCVDICSSNALEAVGHSMSPNELFQTILKDVPFYESSGGGVTFSGGEPLLQYQQLLPLLEMCKGAGISRTIDTSLHVKTEVLKSVSALCDLFLIDLKCIDSQLHKNLTGVDNGLILHNIQYLHEQGASFVIRIPLVKGANCHDENILETIEFLSSLSNDSLHVELMPFHQHGESKYEKLIHSSSSSQFSAPDASEIDSIIQKFNHSGIVCTLA